MPDSDVSLPSGDPDKYWWIGGDDPYQFPAEWEHNKDHPEPADDDSPPTTDDDSAYDNPRVLELEDLTRELQEHVYELEAQGEWREVELARATTSNDALVDRVAALCTYICATWVEQSADKARVKTLKRSLCSAITLIVALVGVVLSMLVM